MLCLRMMTHVNLLAMMLSIAVGMAGIAVVLQAYKKHGHKYLLGFAIYLILLNLMTLLSVVNNYIFLNVFARFVSLQSIITESVYRFTGALVMANTVPAFFYLYRELLGKRAGGRFKWIVYGGNLAVSALMSFMVSRSFAVQLILPALLGYVFIVFFSLLTLIVFNIRLLRKAKSLAEPGKREVIKTFGVIHLVPLILVFAVGMEHLFLDVSNDILLIFDVIFSTTVGALPLLYLKRFMEKYHGPAAMEQAESVTAEHLFEKFNISNREQEIIGLICKGKTNKEIEDALFISVKTVKGHVYSIYRKTGVKNRVQLTNLFRRPLGVSKNGAP